MAKVPTPARPAARTAVPASRAAPQPAQRQAASQTRAAPAPGTPAIIPPRGQQVAVGGAPLPAYMQGQTRAGIENIDARHLELPRIKLLQATSPELTTFNGLKAGEFFHTIAETALGAELTMVPIYSDTRYLLWNPLEAGGGILARADDGVHWKPANKTFEVKLPKNMGGKTVNWTTAPTVMESGLDQWGTMNPEDDTSPPAATFMFAVIVGLPQHPELSPAVLTLQRSAVKVGRKLMGKISISRAPSYGQRFIMTSVQEQGPSGPFFNYMFTGAGLVDDEAEFAGYRDIYEAVRKRGVEILDLEAAQGDQPDTGGGHATTQAAQNEKRY